MKTPRNDARVALWTYREELLCEAIEIDRQIAELEHHLRKLGERARLKRLRAGYVTATAEELGRLDEAGL